MQVAAVKVPVAVRPMVARPAMSRPRQLVLVRSAPSKDQIDAAIKEAKDACDGGDAGEW
jgi:hypothetical protein